MAGKKADKSAVNQRVSEIAELKIKGYSRADILQYASKIIERDGVIVKDNWCVSERQVDEYIKKANQLIEDANRESVAYHTAVVRRRLDTIYNQSMREESYGTALAALKEYSELYGLKKQPQKTLELQSAVTIIDNIGESHDGQH